MKAEIDGNIAVSIHQPEKKLIVEFLYMSKVYRSLESIDEPTAVTRVTEILCEKSQFTSLGCHLVQK